MYPQDAIKGSSNLSVVGTVLSVENNHRRDGMVAGSYHIFSSYILLNVTGILRVDDYLSEWIPIVVENNTVNGRNIII